MNDFLKELEDGLKKVQFTMTIKQIRDDLEKYLKTHNLEKKYKKAKNLFEKDPFYPSLNRT